MRWGMWFLTFLLSACASLTVPPGTEGQPLILGYSLEAEVVRAAELLGASEVEWLRVLRAARLRLPAGVTLEEARTRLRSLGLRYVEEEGMRVLQLLPGTWTLQAVSPYAWHLEAIRVREAWTTSDGAGVRVAVLDAGVDTGHPVFQGRVSSGLDAATGALLPPGSDHSQGEWHGTHVAGLVVGEGVGVAPGALLLPVRVFSPDYVGDFRAAQALVWAVDQGAQVINLSFGGPAYSQLLHEAVNYALERYRVVVAAGGNLGSQARFYPAAFPGVVAVGAVDGQGQPAWFSNRGSWVKVWAPGVRIFSALPGGGFGLLSGTSMASPLASGVAALLKAKRPLLEPYAVRQALGVTPVLDAAAAFQAPPASRPACLYLQVLWQGNGVAGADVSLEGPEVLYAQTNEQGETRFFQIAPGTYRLRLAVSLPEGRVYREETLTPTSFCYAPTQILLP